MNTCDTCKHYSEEEECELFTNGCEPRDDGMTAHGEYGYGAVIYFGPKFGCIHWMAKEAE